MEVVVTLHHPAHVHFYKHALDELQRLGHETHVYALDKDVTLDLLDAYGIEYTVLGTRRSLGSLPLSQLTFEYRLWRATRAVEPDVMTAIGGVAVSHVATAIGARSVVFTDTEHATLSNRLAFPLADHICTPTCYRDVIGPKQYAYPSYHELAYLHPDRYTPDPTALDAVDVDPDDTYVVLRLIGWDAVHNVGGEGFDDLGDVVSRLETTGAEVLITSEKALPSELESYRATVETHRIHDLLSYADLFVGESGTMTAESAVLGTPALYVHSNETGLSDELAEYGLVFPFHGDDRHDAALETAVDLLESPDEYDWAARRERLLADKRDATTVVVERLLAAGGD